MKGIVFTTDEKMYVKDFSSPLYKSVGEVVGGYIEIVHPRMLKAPYCMIIDDEGLLKKYPINPIGCVLYQTWLHGSPIVGNIVIMKEDYVGGSRDIIGLTDEEVSEIKKIAADISCGKIKEVTL